MIIQTKLYLYFRFKIRLKSIEFSSRQFHRFVPGQLAAPPVSTVLVASPLGAVTERFGRTLLACPLHAE
jgi:hypothetical protein